MRKRTVFTAGIALLVAAGILAGCSANKSLDRSSDDKNAGTKHEEPATSEDPKTTVTTTTGTTETSETSDPSDTRETLGDIGEAYYKEATADDIVEYDGLQCVKNQLLVSCNLGTSKEQMEMVCEEVGAEIVGYIEITSDFQIEFKEDKTYEELEEIADYIYGYPFISNITLNTVTSIGYDIVED